MGLVDCSSSSRAARLEMRNPPRRATMQHVIGSVIPSTKPLASESAEPLVDFVDRYPRLFVLTGAGCSTDSGIPDYRDAAGEWKRQQPITYQRFVADEHARKRYWARSLIGFQ